MNNENTVAAVESLMNVIMGCWTAPTLLSATRLQLPERVAEQPRDAAELAAVVGADEGHLRRVMNALCSIGVFRRDPDGRYGPTAASDLLRGDHPAGYAALLDTAVSGQNRDAWTAMEESIRTGRCAFDIRHGEDWIAYLDHHPERRDIFAQAMTATTRATEEAVLNSHDFGKFSQVVDIGGSNASLVGRLLENTPDARGIVFDLPDTVTAGRSHWRDAAFADRLEAVGGDFFKSVPTGDLYLLKLILHDWRDEQARDILRNIRRAIRPGGRVAIIETVLPDEPTPHMGWGLDIAMMVTTGGRERSLPEHTQNLNAAGFEVICCAPTASMYSVIEARAT